MFEYILHFPHKIWPCWKVIKIFFSNKIKVYMSSKISKLKRRKYRDPSVYPIYLEYWLNKQKKNSVSRWLLLEPAILSELFRQIQLICAHISMDKTEKKWKPYSVGTLLPSLFLIWATDRWNGNSTELSPIRSEIIPVFKKIGRARSRSLIC